MKSREKFEEIKRKKKIIQNWKIKKKAIPEKKRVEEFFPGFGRSSRLFQPSYTSFSTYKCI